MAKNSKRIAFLKSIYDSFRKDPVAQMEIRKAIKKLENYNKESC